MSVWETARTYGLVVVSPGSAEEEAAVSALSRAFSSDPFLSWQGADSTWTARYTVSFCEERGAVLALGDGKGGVSSAVCLVRPGEREDGERAGLVLARVGAPPERGEESATRTRAVGETMREAQKRALEKEEGGGDRRWHLWMLGTIPEHRGRGEAKKLVAAVCALADSQRLPVYLETDSAEALYAKFSFERRTQMTVLDYPTPLLAMVRKPRPLERFFPDSFFQFGLSSSGCLVDAGNRLMLAPESAMWTPLSSLEEEERQKGLLSPVSFSQCGDESLWLADLFVFDSTRDPLRSLFSLTGRDDQWAALSKDASFDSFLEFSHILCSNSQALLLHADLPGLAPVVRNSEKSLSRMPMRPALLMTRRESPLLCSLVFSSSPLARRNKTISVVIGKQQDGDKRVYAGSDSSLVARLYNDFLAGKPLVDASLVASLRSVTLPMTHLLPEALFGAMRRFGGEKVAVEDGDEKLSYSQLEDASLRLASTLSSFRGSAVAVVCHSSPSYVVALCACLFAGCPYVPIDPSYPQARVEHILRDSGAVALLTQKSVAAQTSFSTLRRILVDCDSFDDRLASPVAVAANDVAYIIYTSGSTGQPKGVVVEHKGVLNMLEALLAMVDIQPSDSGLHFYGLAFDGSVVNVFVLLLSGAKLIMRGADLSSWTRRMECATVGFLTPSVLAVIDERVLARFKVAFVGGEALSPSVVSRCPCDLLNIYGPTETTVVSSAALLRAHSSDPVVSAGKPLPNMHYSIVNPVTLDLLPVGVIGELLIHGVGVARGYMNLPERTASSFLHDVAGVSGPCYRSGDFAKWLPDGSVQVLGRQDDQVKISGYRIELHEIEIALEQLPGVRLAAALVFNDTVVAFLCPETVVVDHVFLSSKLPSYMIPSSFELRADLPRTFNGKIDKKSLADMLSSRVASSSSSSLSLSKSLPSVALSQRFCALCAVALGLGVFSMEDVPDFNSISAVRMVSLARRELGLEIELASLFKRQTVRGILSGATQKQSSSAAPSLKPVPREDEQSFPLSRNQERLMALHLIDPSSCSYNVPVFYRFSSHSAERVASCVKQLFVRHETLRLVFRGLSQMIRPVSNSDVVVVDCKGGDVSVVQKKQMETPFQLSESAARAVVVSEGASSCVLLLCLHHIVVDGLSVVVLIRDLVELLNDRSLPSLDVQFVDYASAEPRLLTEERVETMLRGYDGLLERLPAPLFPNKQGTSGKGDSVQMRRPLVQFPRQYTPNVVCFSLFVATLLRCGVSSLPDVLVGTVSQNRQMVDGVEDMVGFFVNTVPVRVEFDNCTFEALLKRCQSVFITSMKLQACPFEALVERFGLNLETFFSFVDFVPSFSGATAISQPAVNKFGLELEVELLDQGKSAQMTWLFDSERIPREKVERLATHYCALLESVSSILSSAVLLPKATTEFLARRTSLSCHELEQRAQALFLATPLLCSPETHFSVDEVESDAALEELASDHSIVVDCPFFSLHIIGVVGGGRSSLVTMAASCCDAYSLEVFMRYLETGIIPSLLPSAVLVEDHSVAALETWSRLLVDVPLLADIPVDFVRPLVLSRHKRKRVVHHAGADLLRLVKSDGIALSVAVGLVLGVHCVRQQVVLVGHTVREQLDSVGHLTRIVPLRIDCSGESSFENLLAACHSLLKEGPPILFDALASALDGSSGSGRTKLVQICTSLGRCGPPAGLAEIACHLDEEGNLTWEYFEELWSRETVEVFHGHLLAFAANYKPGVPSKAISLISAQEHKLLQVGFCSRHTTTDVEEMHEYFVRQMIRNGAAPAVWEKGVTITYSELLERAKRVRVPAGNVGVLVSRSIDCIVAQLAILWNGGVFVPIDPAYPAARIEFILQDAAVSGVSGIL